MTASPAHDADAGAPDGAGTGATPGPVRRKRSAKRQLAATTLATESLMVLFGTLVAYGLRAAPPLVLGIAGGALALVLLVLSGSLGRPGGYLAGTLVQVPVLASGFVLLAAPVAGAGFGAVDPLRHRRTVRRAVVHVAAAGWAHRPRARRVRRRESRPLTPRSTARLPPRPGRTSALGAVPSR